VKTQVAIVGAGPAGLLLGHLLRRAEIDVVILERQSRAHVLARVRAGVLERVTMDLVDALGLGERMHAEGLLHRGFHLADGERLIRIDIAELTGRHVMVYGQTELTRDLVEAAPERGLEIRWEVAGVAFEGIDGATPAVRFEEHGARQRIEARFVAGCDGFHGPSRQAIPRQAVTEYERVYPFGWLGILADVPPCHDELVYANHERGFALASMRSMTRSRYYIQVPIAETVAAWPDERLWDELALRLGPTLAAAMARGPSIEKSIAPLRSYVVEPLRYGNLFLAGDAGHIVPPTGAKGLNLAAADVAYLAEALIGYLRRGDGSGIDGYSARALARVWKAVRFSWALTELMHRFPDASPFERRMQRAELDFIASSRAAQAAIAENYAGLPL
jgi:p-hydroxybenzoate 3-monooxygenase